MCAAVYIYRDIVAERREEMLQGRFLPGGLSMQKKATMLQTTIPETYPKKGHDNIKILFMGKAFFLLIFSSAS